MATGASECTSAAAPCSVTSGAARGSGILRGPPPCRLIAASPPLPATSVRQPWRALRALPGNAWRPLHASRTPNARNTSRRTPSLGDTGQRRGAPFRIGTRATQSEETRGGLLQAPGSRPLLDLALEAGCAAAPLNEANGKRTGNRSTRFQPCCIARHPS